VVVVQLVDVSAAGVSVLLAPHGVLVHGGVGLRGGVVGGRDAVTGLAAVVAVPVVHGAVRILVCSRGNENRMMGQICTLLWLVLLAFNVFITYI